MSVKLEDLISAAQGAAARALADLDARGIRYFVTYTLRTAAEQAALYAQGRQPLLAVNALREAAGMPHIAATENTYTVTDCDGRPIAQGGTGRSPHQLGIALDVVPEEGGGPIWPDVTDTRWTSIANSFVAAGFLWGGDWNGDGRTRHDGDMSETLVDYPHYQLKA